MNLNGYDAWKTTEPIEYEEPFEEPEPYILDDISEEWLEFWLDRTLPFKPSEVEDDLNSGGIVRTGLSTAA